MPAVGLDCAEGRSGFEGRVGHEKARRPSRRAMADVVGISYHRPSRLSERSDNFDAYSTEFLLFSQFLSV